MPEEGGEVEYALDQQLVPGLTLVTAQLTVTVGAGKEKSAKVSGGLLCEFERLTVRNKVVAGEGPLTVTAPVGRSCGIWR